MVKSNLKIDITVKASSYRSFMLEDQGELPA